MRAFTQLGPALNSLTESGSLFRSRSGGSSKRFIARADHPAERLADRAADHALAGRPSAGSPSAASHGSASLRSAGRLTAPPAVDRVLASSGDPLDADTRAFMEPQFARDFSRIRIHADSEAAESAHAIGAQAYTSANHVVFGRGQYRPAHPEGSHLLAHELAHTVQQGDESLARTVFRRRIPGKAELESEVAGPDLPGQEEGLIRVIRGAWDELGLTYEQQVEAEKKGQVATRDFSKQAQVLLEIGKQLGIHPQSGPDLMAFLENRATRKQLLQVVEIIRKVDPTVELTDRTSGQELPDETKLNELIAEADKVYSAVASGARDSDLGDVFGATNIAAAKASFAKAKTQIHAIQKNTSALIKAVKNKDSAQENALRKKDLIFTDPSGFSQETHVGGFAAGSSITMLSKFIDKPHDPVSVAVAVHESTHAGNPGVVEDKGYILSPGFEQMAEPDKLTNAADYEVIAWRMVDNTSPEAHPGKKFNPGTTSQKKQDIIRAVSETYRSAWDGAGDLHNLYNLLFKHPDAWNTFDVSNLASGPPTVVSPGQPPTKQGVTVGAHFSDCVPFWSKVENMTIHKRSSIDPKAGKAATNPVTEIDLAQSENVIRKFYRSMKLVPQTDAELGALEAKALPSQAAHFAPPGQPLTPQSVQDEAKVVVTLVRSQKLNQEITGDVARDVAAIDELDKADQQFSKQNNLAYALISRSPSAFPFP